MNNSIQYSWNTLKTCISKNLSADSISSLNAGMLLETVNFCGKLSLHLIHFVFNGSFSCSYHEKFKSHASLYMCFPVRVAGDISPSGSKVDANCFNIPIFDCSFTGMPISYLIVSFDLSQGIPNILQSVARFPNSCFEYESSDKWSSSVSSSSLAFECHLYNSIHASPKIFSDVSLIFLTFSTVTYPVTMSST